MKKLSCGCSPIAHDEGELVTECRNKRSGNSQILSIILAGTDKAYEDFLTSRPTWNDLMKNVMLPSDLLGLPQTSLAFDLERAQRAAYYAASYLRDHPGYGEARRAYESSCARVEAIVTEMHEEEAK